MGKGCVQSIEIYDDYSVVIKYVYKLSFIERLFNPALNDEFGTWLKDWWYGLKEYSMILNNDDITIVITTGLQENDSVPYTIDVGQDELDIAIRQYIIFNY